MPTWPGDRGSHVAESDRPAVVRLAEHAMAACPTDDLVRLLAACDMAYVG